MLCFYVSYFAIFGSQTLGVLGEMSLRKTKEKIKNIVTFTKNKLRTDFLQIFLSCKKIKKIRRN